MSAGAPTPNQTLSFAAQVDQWVRESEKRLLAVFQEASQDLLEEMQTPVAAGGNMPVDTGFLRASVRVTLDGHPPATLEIPNGGEVKYEYNPAVAILSIVSAEIGDTLYFSYTANYARPQHYGYERSDGTRFEGRQWVALAAQRWPQIVTAAANRLKSAMGKT